MRSLTKEVAIISRPILKTVVALMFSFPLLTSCDGGKSSGNSLIDHLSGTWLKGKGDTGYCQNNEEKTSSTQTSLTIKNDYTYVESVSAFKGVDCKSKQITSDQTGALNILGTSEAVPEAIQFTRSISKFEITWATDAGVTLANKDSGYCEKPEWVKGEAKEVTDAICTTSDGKKSPFKSRLDGEQNADRNIFKLSEDANSLFLGSKDGRVNAGDADDSCDPVEVSEPREACYPTALEEDANAIFYRSEEAEKEEE